MHLTRNRTSHFFEKRAYINLLYTWCICISCVYFKLYQLLDENQFFFLCIAFISIGYSLFRACTKVKVISTFICCSCIFILLLQHSYQGIENHVFYKNDVQEVYHRKSIEKIRIHRVQSSLPLFSVGEQYICKIQRVFEYNTRFTYLCEEDRTHALFLFESTEHYYEHDVIVYKAADFSYIEAMYYNSFTFSFENYIRIYEKWKTTYCHQKVKCHLEYQLQRSEKGEVRVLRKGFEHRFFEMKPFLQSSIVFGGLAKDIQKNAAESGYIHVLSLSGAQFSMLYYIIQRRIHTYSRSLIHYICLEIFLIVIFMFYRLLLPQSLAIVYGFYHLLIRRLMIIVPLLYHTVSSRKTFEELKQEKGNYVETRMCQHLIISSISFLLIIVQYKNAFLSSGFFYAHTYSLIIGYSSFSFIKKQTQYGVLYITNLIFESLLSHGIHPLSFIHATIIASIFSLSYICEGICVLVSYIGGMDLPFEMCSKGTHHLLYTYSTLSKFLNPFFVVPPLLFQILLFLFFSSLIVCITAPMKRVKIGSGFTIKEMDKK